MKYMLREPFALTPKSNKPNKSNKSNNRNRR